MRFDLQAVLRHAGDLQRATSLHQLVQVTYAAVQEQTRYRHAWLAIVSADRRWLHVVEVRGDIEQLALATCPRIAMDTDAMAREVFATQAPLVIPEASTDPRTDKNIVGVLKNRTIVNVPMAVGTESVGCLGVGTFADEGVMVPTEQELETLVVFATQLASAWARLEIVERQAAEREARTQLERQLEAMQRVELMGVLASGVAHDLNNFLHVVQSNLSILTGASPADVEALADANHAAARAQDVVHQLLSLGRESSPQRTRMDLNDRVVSTLKLVRSSLPRGVELQHVTTSAPMVEGDPVQIEQALANLLINARDAVGPQGRITVGVRGEDVNSEFVRVNPWAKPGRFSAVQVRDTGPGIPAELLPRIYDPLFSTKATGTGLGLAVVSRVVAQHGGFVHVESAPGRGTTFDVYWPALPDQPRRTQTPV